MNDKFTNHVNGDDENVARKLSQVAEQTHVNTQFAADLEQQLRDTHQPKMSWSLSLFKNVSPTLRWVAIMILLVLVLSWSIKSLIPAPQPAINNIPGKFVCPVTLPNRSQPYGKTVQEDPNFHGNGQLWTKLWPNGKIYISPSDQMPDGSFSQKWYFERGVHGALTIEGHRLDAEAAPLRADIPDGYGDTGLQVLSLIFPTTGCWEVTGRVGEASLTFVTEVVFGEATPTPAPVVIPNESATPVTEDNGYDWRGTKLYLAQPLPQSPAEANVYSAQPEQPATIESVLALAGRFGLKGQVFEGQFEPNALSAFSVVDGNQILNVRSDRYFEYILDSTKVGAASPFSMSNPNAEAIIEEFMSSHNFDFPYKVEATGLYQGYFVQALTPDGLPLHHEYFGQNGLLFRLNDKGIISVSASLLKYDTVGTYEIKSADEAFQQVVASADYRGMIEGVHSSAPVPQIWKRDYPTNQTITLYGFLSAVPSVDGKDLLVNIDSFKAKGNLAGTEKLGKITLVKATGQFTLEKEKKIFNVESWEVFKKDDHGYSGKDAFLGRLQKQGDQVIFVGQKGTFVLPDMPAEIPLPLENAYVYGVTLGNTFEWEGIEHSEASGGGGGGGGGSNGAGFYKLKLSGSPVPFPTTASQPDISQANVEYIIQEGDTVLSIARSYGTTPEKIFQANSWLEGGVLMPGKTLIIPGAQSQNPYVGRRFENQRGIFTVTIYQKADGTQRLEYNFITSKDGENFYFLLKGDNLQELEKYHNRPVEITGAITTVDQYNVMTFEVERYSVPFPDLSFQILHGKQKLADIQGGTVILFTTDDGTTYVQLTPIGDPFGDRSLTGIEGDEIVIEALIIPNESFSGYPTLRAFSSSLAVNPKNGQATELSITADKPAMMDDSQNPGSYVAPTLTIEKVELVYYAPDSRYAKFDATSGAQYIQPAWRFYGHYENGDECQILIQALKQEFLLPELAPYTPPG